MKKCFIGAIILFGKKLEIGNRSKLKKYFLPLMLNFIIGQKDLPTQKTWRLNERHYGGLTGLNKAETAEKHGEAQVQIWRRSFDTPPPAMEAGHPYHENITKVGHNFVQCHVPSCSK